ncbi:PREDICTED: glutamate receptor [Prunus dulcis]|uniref:PREDICTED: glutamate receptor n=1 Tax=Prunus dulcis TaxID=3755 RepID=A0A5E4E8D6_PRUDU|nr:PREDICTED: glutamate receptor [Prunus dulcis]
MYIRVSLFGQLEGILDYQITQPSKFSNMVKKNPPNLELLLSIFFFFLCSWISLAMAQNKTIPVNVGVVLDDLNSRSGKIWLSCIKMALSDFYASHANYKTRLVLNTGDSKQNVVGAAKAAVDLIKNAKVQAILGPVTSMQAGFLINLGDQVHVPIISFSATSPSLNSLRSSYFFQFAQNDSSQVKALSAIVKDFGWRQVVPVYIDNEFGEGVIPFLTDALEEVDARVPYRSAISPSATDGQILEELYKLMTMQTRVFIVHMRTDLSSRLFAKAREIGMMTEGYVWLTTNGIPNELRYLNSSIISSMQGVLGIQTYVPQTLKLEEFMTRWKRQFQQDNPTIIDASLDVFGLWAYDSAFALAMAIEEVGTATFGFQKTNTSFNSAVLESFEVSKYGPELCQALSTTRFEGIAGDFGLVDGQLQSKNFEIVNINGGGARRIGFWTPQNGLVKKLGSSANSSIFSTPKRKLGLGPIIWPGDSLSVPKGWENPTNGKKLRIGVPVKDGFTELVKVMKDPSTNMTDVTGFSIDVFKAAVEMLPYALPYEFIPFAKSDGTSAGTYNDLVYQIYLGNYDAAVGDITIRANRSLYVDFTLPYTESGVSMIVPIKDNKSKNAWVFLKPLTWDLWVTSGCFFIFIGFVVWVLEHRINEDFRGPPHHQIGTSFWFSFSTMVFAHRERVVSNLARFVVIIWCFVVLILTQSYTASLTSLLTVQQLQPTVTDVNLLLKYKDNVAYQPGSFVHGILKELGFQDENLKTFNTPEELNQLFQNGSRKNGISAAFDETPYMKLFLATYCSKYTMVDPTFKADGFAFVFPKGSPLARDVSRGILNVNEGNQTKVIEDRWFKKQNCVDPNSLVSSNSLSLESFWGLFLIAGVASTLALLIFAAMFLYEHKDIFKQLDPEASLWKRFLIMLRIYDNKDLKSFTFKKRELEVNTNFPPSPSVYSDHTEARNVFEEQMGTPSSADLEHAGFSPGASTSRSEMESAIEITERPRTHEIDPGSN